MLKIKMDGIGITDLIWNSSNFVLDLKESLACPTSILAEQNEFSDKTPRPSKALVDIKQYKQLIEIKEKIQNCNHWDKWSKLINPYDKISYLAKNKNTKDYYKFFEIIKHFNLNRESSDSLESSAHMGDSSLDSSKAIAYFLPKINWYASVERSDSFLESKDEKGYSRLFYFEPEITLVENLKNFREMVGKCNIITCDCTADTKHDPNNQEQLTFYLLFAQVVTALHMQLEKGHLIVKIFDTITRPTCQLIYYLTKFYEHVSVIKPRTSRYTNSEKFIVARKFKGISDLELNVLDKTLNDWDPEQYFRILGIEIPEEIEKDFLMYNRTLIENQYKYIEKTIKCNYDEDEIPDKQLEAFQNKNALLFCSNFGIPVNLADSDISMCKHPKKKKIQIGSLKNTMVCEKCFSLLLTKN